MLVSVLGKTTALIEGVRPEQRTLPTPCPDLDVAALTDHLVGWLLAFAARAAAEEPAVDPNAYRCGADPAGEFAAASRRAVAAAPDPKLLGMMLIEYVGHGWDLAVATGQPVPYTDAEAQAALDAARGMLRPAYRGPGKTFGYEVEVGAGASTVERLVAFIGRDPVAAR
ncbi:TIGR03086 family metal-binding protein [Asanoa sp. NPDC049573]|uniref:TIGR03086 family metal-binding protein n=1 Tax=Asanoa sp. NPDC049573 TaxID=3155396 RepID=UPI00341AC192